MIRIVLWRVASLARRVFDVLLRLDHSVLRFGPVEVGQTHHNVRPEMPRRVRAHYHLRLAVWVATPPRDELGIVQCLGERALFPVQCEAEAVASPR